MIEVSSKLQNLLFTCFENNENVNLGVKQSKAHNAIFFAKSDRFKMKECFLFADTERVISNLFDTGKFTGFSKLVHPK